MFQSVISIAKTHTVSALISDIKPEEQLSLVAAEDTPTVLITSDALHQRNQARGAASFRIIVKSPNVQLTSTLNSKARLEGNPLP